MSRLLTYSGRDKIAVILYDIFNYIILKEKICVLIQMSLKFVLNGSINNKPVLVQIMARRQVANKPLSEAIIASMS